MSTRHDLVAERQLLAMALSGHPSVREKFLTLPVQAWHASTEPVATVLRDRMRRSIPVNGLTVAADVAATVADNNHAEQLTRFVNDCSATCPPLDTWAYYVEQVLTCYSIREADKHAQRFAQRLETVAEPGELAQAVRLAVDGLTAVTEQVAAPDVEPPIGVEDLIAEGDDDYDWLVPGLLERTDRLVVTGFEGTGKSVLLKQFALTIAAGLHPFTGETTNRHGNRVLVLDYENSRPQVKRTFRKHLGNIKYLRDAHGLPSIDWNDHLRTVIEPAGIDITDLREFARLEAKIAAAAPDLVVVGPLYRLSKADIKDDQASKAIADALDELRVKYRFTLIIEAHAGHIGEAQGGRKIRPFGSSLWLRWPEFGVGVRGFGDAANEEHPSVVELVHWRGSRDERDWPKLLKHGRLDNSPLPWVVGNLDYGRPKGEAA